MPRSQMAQKGRNRWRLAKVCCGFPQGLKSLSLSPDFHPSFSLAFKKPPKDLRLPRGFPGVLPHACDQRGYSSGPKSTADSPQVYRSFGAGALTSFFPSRLSRVRAPSPAPYQIDEHIMEGRAWLESQALGFCVLHGRAPAPSAGELPKLSPAGVSPGPVAPTPPR